MKGFSEVPASHYCGFGLQGRQLKMTIMAELFTHTWTYNHSQSYGLFNPVSNKQKSKYCSLFRDDFFECRL